MAKRDPTVHMFWVWLLLAVSAPFMRGTWKVWVAATMVLLLILEILLTHFSKRLPGQEWIKKLVALAEYISPAPNPKNRPLGLWRELLLRLLVNVLISGTAILAEVELGLTVLWFIGISVVASMFIGLRFDEDEAMGIVLGWCGLAFWCGVWYLINAQSDPEISLILTNSTLAHFLRTHTEKKHC
jgi:hypothetical protein